jgi:hypothetical protein
MDHAPDRLSVPVIMAVPTVAGLVALYQYERTGSKTALATAATVTSIAWVGLSGLLHGGNAHAYKNVLFLTGGPAKLYYPLNPSEHYPPDDLLSRSPEYWRSRLHSLLRGQPTGSSPRWP